MKAILMSDRPKWCALMMNKKKKVEVRKGTALYKAIQKLIDEYGYADIYVYCTKGKPNLWLPYEYDCFELDEASQPYLSDKPIVDIDTKMNGKVIFKFRCYNVEKIDRDYVYDFFINDVVKDWFKTNSLQDKELYEKSCLTKGEMYKYLKPYARICKGYAIHISDLEIFDKPKKLSEFKSYKKNIVNTKINGMVFETELDNSLTKAPQSWCYVEVE